MKETLKGLVFIAGIIYAIIALICSVYFNYKFAIEHTFWEWFFFGQIIPTYQGMFWPFFI